ncbi:hypothetical protein GQR58_004086 [Nymphon striatum]|nr:hypothetical protein GQR58_004086 [Nymphon striatum]
MGLQETFLLQCILKRKASFFGHIARGSAGEELKMIIAEGWRKVGRGRRRRRWMDDVELVPTIDICHGQEEEEEARHTARLRLTTDRENNYSLCNAYGNICMNPRKVVNCPAVAERIQTVCSTDYTLKLVEDLDPCVADIAAVISEANVSLIKVFHEGLSEGEGKAKGNQNSLDGHDMMFNDEVIASIEESLFNYNEDFDDTVTMNITLGRYREKYWATELNTNLPENAQTTSGRNDYDHEFRVVENNYRLKSEYIDRDYSASYSEGFLTLDDCVKQCRLEQDFYCESFSYCENHHSCQLSHRNPDSDGDLNKTELVLQTDCAVFTRLYSDDYKEYKGIIIAGAGKKVKENNANACAKECNEMNKKDEKCESFDICDEEDPKKTYCIFHDTHILDLHSSKEISASDECNHYSKIYLKDYQRHGKYALSSKAVLMEYTKVSVENCSKICSEAEKCTGFDFCTGGMSPITVCHLTTDKPSEAGVLVKSPLCKFYDKISDSPRKTKDIEKREINPKTSEDRIKLNKFFAQAKSIQTNNQEKTPDNLKDHLKENGISNGAVGGLAFLMFVIGAAVSASVLFIIFRYKSVRN